jgi:hypothetical protein
LIDSILNKDSGIQKAWVYRMVVEISFENQNVIAPNIKANFNKIMALGYN